MKKTPKYLIIILLLVLLDFITKNIFHKTTNVGSIWNIFPNNFFWISISTILLIGILFNFKNFKNKIIPSVLLSGLIGNLIDRIVFSGVRDFISIERFPTFNLADSYITLTITIIIYRIIKNESI